MFNSPTVASLFWSAAFWGETQGAELRRQRSSGGACFGETEFQATRSIGSG